MYQNAPVSIIYDLRIMNIIKLRNFLINNKIIKLYINFLLHKSLHKLQHKIYICNFYNKTFTIKYFSDLIYSYM